MSDQGVLIAVIATLIVLGLVAGWAVVAGMKRRRARQLTAQLEDQFGPEYQRAREKYGREADRELTKRVDRVRRLHLTPLKAEAREGFSAAWRSTQTRFVDDPQLAVAEADRLIIDVMEARGYPMVDFERRAADISVEHPQVVSDYRAAHEIAVRSRNHEASTEELRKAMVHYKALFQDLLVRPAHEPAREMEETATSRR